jgi:hypothetical protein
MSKKTLWTFILETHNHIKERGEIVGEMEGKAKVHGTKG